MTISLGLFKENKYNFSWLWSILKIKFYPEEAISVLDKHSRSIKYNSEWIFNTDAKFKILTQSEKLSRIYGNPLFVLKYNYLVQ